MLLGCGNLGLQLGGALIDDLQLGQVRVEDADDLRNLFGNVSMKVKSLVQDVDLLTGSSARLVLLRVAEAPFTSSIMLVRSLPISSRRSESFSASLYLSNESVYRRVCSRVW